MSAGGGTVEGGITEMLPRPCARGVMSHGIGVVRQTMSRSGRPCIAVTDGALTRETGDVVMEEPMGQKG